MGSVGSALSGSVAAAPVSAQPTPPPPQPLPAGERGGLDNALQAIPKGAELPPGAVDAAQGAAAGAARVWQQLPFSDLFADVAGGSQAGQPGAAQPGGLTALQGSMELLVRGVRALVRELGQSAEARVGVGQSAELTSLLQRTEAGFVHGLELLSKLGRQREMPVLLEYLEQLVLSAHDMQVGSILAVPAAWPTTAPIPQGGAAAAAAAAAPPAPAGGGAYLLVLQRADEKYFSVTLVNTGLGLEYHPCRADPRTGLLQRNLGVVLRKVPRERLADSGFWFLLYRRVFAPREGMPKSAGEAPAHVYGTLLPALNDQPLMAGVDAATLRWRAPPLGADATHASCVLDAFEAALFACGATDAQCAYAATLWRWTMLQTALAELADATQRGEPFSASDGVLLRLAARHTARNVAALADGPPQLGPAYAASLQATLSKLDTVVRRAHEHITAATV